MSEKAKLWDLPGLEKRIPPASTATRFRWQLPIEFVLALALIGDALVVFAAFAYGFWVRFDSGSIPFFSDVTSIPTFSDYFRLLVAGTVCLLGTFCYLRLYTRRCFVGYLRTARVIVQGTIFWLLAYLSVSLILKFDPPISRLFMLISFVCVMGAMLAWRVVFFKIMHWELFGINFRQRILFVGWGKEAEHLEREIQNDFSHPYEIIGCVLSLQGQLDRQLPPTVPYLGHFCNLGALLEQHCMDIAILADFSMSMDEIIGMVNQCEMEFVQFKVIPSYFQTFTSSLRLETIGGFPVLGVSELPLDRFVNRLIKRGIDIVGAIVGLLLSVPLMVIFGALVYRESPGPIFYRQERMGRNGRTFNIFKIRSMRMCAEENGAQWAKENDPRRLRVGAFMRKWNIDEVPQFFNVLKGDMSLVGPRPERPELILSFKFQVPHYHARHTCLPGMTGWAQVNGWRGDTSLEERIRFDIWYIENWSIGLDIRILILTFRPQKNAY